MGCSGIGGLGYQRMGGGGSRFFLVLWSEGG